MSLIKKRHKPVSKTAGLKRKSGQFVADDRHGSDAKNKAFNNTAILTLGTEKAESKMTSMEKMARLETGISKKDLENLKSRASLDYDKLSSLLLVTRATLINKRSAENFSLALSERILGLAEIYSFGYEVFEDEGSFNTWMFRENRALGGKTPFEVCNNQFGREEVRNIIGRIHYGVYS